MKRNNFPLTRKLIKRSDSQKIALINSFKTSGQTITAYCKKKGIHVSQFYAWKNKLVEGESQTSKSDFIQVRPSIAISQLNISLPNGIQITTSGSPSDLSVIKSLMDL